MIAAQRTSAVGCNSLTDMELKLLTCLETQQGFASAIESMLHDGGGDMWVVCGFVLSRYHGMACIEATHCAPQAC